MLDGDSHSGSYGHGGADIECVNDLSLHVIKGGL